MKILFISHTPNWDGAENVLYTILEGLDRNRFEPLVCLPSLDGILSRKIQSLDIPQLQVDLKWCVHRPDVAEDFSDGLQDRVDCIVRIARKENIDLIFTNTSVIREGGLAAREVDVPHICTVHEVYKNNPELTPLEGIPSFLKTLGEHCQKVIVIGSSIHSEFKGIIPDDKIVVIPNCISVARKIPPRFQTPIPTVCFVGAISERKGAHLLPLIAKKTVEKIPRCLFKILGSDRNLTLRNEVEKLGLSQNFEFLGYRMDVLEQMSNSDCLLLPSICDPMPLVIHEAMAVGLPVVGTLESGAAEMVMHGETGFLASVNDLPQLAEYVVRLLEDPHLNLVLGRAGQDRWKEKFQSDAFVRKIENAIQTSIASSRIGSNAGMFLGEAGETAPSALKLG